MCDMQNDVVRQIGAFCVSGAQTFGINGAHEENYAIHVFINGIFKNVRFSGHVPDCKNGTHVSLQTAQRPTIPQSEHSLRHKLLFRTKEKRSEYVRPDSTGLLETLEEINQLFPKVKYPREATFDSHVLKLASELGSEQASNLQTNMTVFDLCYFAEKLVTFRNSQNSANNVLDWSKLGKAAATRFSITPKLDFIYGPLAMEPIIKTRAARERVVQKKPRESEKKKPLQLQQEEQEESTTKEVQRVLKAIHKLTDPEQGHYRHVPFFEFITDPTSFATTIENMFHLSFLVKDGKVRLYLDDDNVPVVKMNIQGSMITSTPSTTNKINASQVVIGMTMKKWRDLISEFNITKSMIPNIKRAKVKHT